MQFAKQFSVTLQHLWGMKEMFSWSEVLYETVSINHFTNYFNGYWKIVSRKYKDIEPYFTSNKCTVKFFRVKVHFNLWQTKILIVKNVIKLKKNHKHYSEREIPDKTNFEPNLWSEHKRVCQCTKSMNYFGTKFSLHKYLSQLELLRNFSKTLAFVMQHHLV